MNERVLGALGEWTARQRWYSRATAPDPVMVGTIRLGEDTADRRIRILLIADRNETDGSIRQVPVVEYGSLPLGMDAHVVAEDGDRVLVDGPHDPEFARALITAIAGDARVAATITGSRVLGVEQSNTSIVVSRRGGRDIIVKIFRSPRNGANPDADVVQRLTSAGFPYVPTFVGAVEADWLDPSGESHRGHLAVAQEFVPDAVDAWAIANVEAGSGRGFLTEAAELGRATAALHRVLAEVYPTVDATPERIAALCASWNSRLDHAVRDAPALAEYHDGIRAVYDAAAAAPWPRLQRVHGDLHLGQILGTNRPERSHWLFVDFEGEPLRPIAERVEPEPAARDVAGMLRSFDYAGIAAPQNLDWAARCRAAYLDGYRDGGGSDANPVLLTALELDKAVYEVTYEARNRPTWLPIPLAAIIRILAIAG